MEGIHKTQAGALAIALSQGYADLSEITQWADAQIEFYDEPDVDLLDLSLTASESEALTLLNRLAVGVDVWDMNSLFLGRFRFHKSMSLSEANVLSKYLYFLVIDAADTPKQFSCFASHWDAIDLAAHGFLGSLEDSIKQFLEDVHQAANLAKTTT